MIQQNCPLSLIVSSYGLVTSFLHCDLFEWCERGVDFLLWKLNYKVRKEDQEVEMVCVCVCTCMCLYFSTVKASSDCKTFKTYLRGTDQRSWVVNIYLGAFCQVPSSLFPNLSHFTSKDVILARQKTGENTRWYTGILWKDDIYEYMI